MWGGFGYRNCSSGCNYSTLSGELDCGKGGSICGERVPLPLATKPRGLACRLSAGQLAGVTGLVARWDNSKQTNTANRHVGCKDLHNRKIPGNQVSRPVSGCFLLVQIFQSQPPPWPLPHTSAKRCEGLFCFAFCYFTTPYPKPSPCTPSLALTGVCSEVPAFAAAVLPGAVGILLKLIANGCMDRKHQPPSYYSNQRVKTRGGGLEPFGCLLGVQHDLLSGAPVNKHIQSGAPTLSDALDKVVC